MRKILFTLTLLLVLLTSFQTETSLAKNNPSQDSEELRLQDMLMNMLTPNIEKDLRSYYYPKVIKDFSPVVAPWKIKVIETKRINGFRGFILQITFEIEPTDGGQWVPIGKDRMTYEISSGPEIKLINHTHLKTYKLPSDSKD
ncbi:DUF3888 domain-containing protein (plasmid) [Ureibacillus chungkukjangi]|uniref:DUF3888 domain-containing protein n=1 Tax=Ureibacillus chungkukjangi TaxID=1202712 RepID=UPI000D3859CE|nr:DUF3888 domain-containing protein [Ureibacillus chungkukjangi]MCM3390560.1 DUF3888 domain-containing protein [Ureibacillus chungkukjangi]MDI7743520.1 DUF3888 domain-containing protein [Lysinibacillus fusiformis]HCG4536092.1 DUF3888 domain-containing protein [Salmonella enterica subsp. enterica serovar Typhi str. AG3]